MMSNNEKKIRALTISLRLSPYWWAFVIRGIFLLFFGVFFVLYPASAWTLFSVTNGTFCLVEAAFNFYNYGLVWFINDVENRSDLMMLFFFNSVWGVSVGTILAINSPVPSERDNILLLASWMMSVGINQLWLAYMVRPADHFGSCFMGWISLTFVVTGITFRENLEGSTIGTFISPLGICLAMYGVQLIFFGVGLLRTYGNGHYPVAAAASTYTIDV